MVRLSNVLGVIAIMLLMLWAAVFIAINIFNFKLFSWQVTSLFMAGVVPILAVSFGALAMNIMFNLTLIAQQLNFITESKQ